MENRLWWCNSFVSSLQQWSQNSLFFVKKWIFFPTQHIVPMAIAWFRYGCVQCINIAVDSYVRCNHWREVGEGSMGPLCNIPQISQDSIIISKRKVKNVHRFFIQLELSFFFRYEAFLRISHGGVCLMEMNSLSFCLPGKVFISPSYLKEIFVGQSILG